MCPYVPRLCACLQLLSLLEWSLNYREFPSFQILSNRRKVAANLSEENMRRRRNSGEEVLNLGVRAICWATNTRARALRAVMYGSRRHSALWMWTNLSTFEPRHEPTRSLERAGSNGSARSLSRLNRLDLFAGLSRLLTSQVKSTKVGRY